MVKITFYCLKHLAEFDKTTFMFILLLCKFIYKFVTNKFILLLEYEPSIGIQVK